MFENFNIYSSYLGYEKEIRIYLPKGYDGKKAFKVIYAMDGQNLYIDDDASYHMAWRIQEVMEELNRFGKIEEFIIVGIVSDDKRMEEYSPFKNDLTIQKFIQDDVCGGNGDNFAKFVVLELKTFIDKHYKTLSDYESTSIIGSSMGAYISLYIATMYKGIFKNVGLLSIALFN